MLRECGRWKFGNRLIEKTRDINVNMDLYSYDFIISSNFYFSYLIIFIPYIPKNNLCKACFSQSLHDMIKKLKSLKMLRKGYRYLLTLWISMYVTVIRRLDRRHKVSQVTLYTYYMYMTLTCTYVRVCVCMCFVCVKSYLTNCIRVCTLGPYQQQS